MMMLDRGNRAPALYLQLAAHFRDQIMAGTLPPGSQLPTEIELTETFEVSRNTVRQAMNLLVNEGLLARTQGRGTFVRAVQTQIGHGRYQPSALYGDGHVSKRIADHLATIKPFAQKRLSYVTEP